MFLYGNGIFTTLAVVDGKPFLWEKHWRRLLDNAAKLELDLSQHAERAVLGVVAESVAQNKIENGRARITFFDESPSEIWGGFGADKTSLSILTAGPRAISNSFKLTVSPHLVNSTSPLAGIKSCNYLNHLIAFEKAKGRGFDEAVRLNERGDVASACMANVFWAKGGRLFTPSLKTGCLAGTTREYVLENLDCEEVEAGIDALRAADEIFLTSAGIGVVSVSALDSKKKQYSGHPITKLLPF